jgi:hypothetical protein
MLYHCSQATSLLSFSYAFEMIIFPLGTALATVHKQALGAEF